MFSKKITAAVFAIAIASSLIVISGSYIGSAFAVKKNKESDNSAATNNSDGTDKSSSSQIFQSPNSGNSIGDTGNSNSISAKDLKSLSKCQSSAADDGDLTRSEVDDCYSQVFNQEQGKQDQSTSALGNDKSSEGQG